MDPFLCSALRRSLLCATFLLLAPPASLAEGFDATVVLREIQSSRLDPARAVSLKGTRLAAGLATLVLEDGVLFPASPAGGKTREMVFLGRGRILLEPPDDVEKGQLELFTGATRLDEAFTEMVLVLGQDAAVEALLRKPAAPSDTAKAQRAAELYSAWKEGPERKRLDVDGALLADASGDLPAQGYVAARLKGGELGDFLYVVEPGMAEQVMLGAFKPLEATEKEKRKILKRIDRQQREGRLIGFELEDRGQWDTWLSGSVRGKDGQPSPGVSSFEPVRYQLEVSLADADLRLSAKARIDLAPQVQGARTAWFNLNSDLLVRRVTDGTGAGLPFHRAGTDLLVVLPEVPGAQDTVTVVVEYDGVLIEKEGDVFALRDTIDWYPHAGTVDRAPYEATFEWPSRVDLLAAGRRADGGQRKGRLWERRVLDVPAAFFTFEVGHFAVETVQAGHVEVKVAFDREGKYEMKREDREEIRKAVVDSLLYFESLFGPYPLDELTVVNVPRDFSQAGLGFITLSTWMIRDVKAWYWERVPVWPDRRMVVAHEVSHQWWGHQVGWSSYRDQWISEAMANYSALLFGRNQLRWNERFGHGLTTGWQEELTAETAAGRSIESLGPVVLGTRLFSSRSNSGAYQAIVYRKGAVVLEMLARALGEESFPKVLRQVVKATANRPITTRRFLDLIEQITDAELDAFAEQFIYGTGLPEVYYTYRIEPRGGGRWVIQGEARQQAPYRFRYRVVKTAHGTLDVAREKLDPIRRQGSTLVVPFEADVYDPAKEGKELRDGKEAQGNAVLRGQLVLKGERTPFAVESDYEPSRFFLDREEVVFGLFYNEKLQPKRMLYYQGLDASAAGLLSEAEALFRRAQGAELGEEIDATARPRERMSVKKAGRLIDALIELSLARVYLDQGKDAQAQESLDRAHRVLGVYGGRVEEDLAVL
ncbi:MAG TPA: M1 family aminopeptidase, partial [Thermoanaerobaculia bacterium]|nr:M1 family aminopeptidase [Thermoanaerobaculia bacterium]